MRCGSGTEQQSVTATRRTGGGPAARRPAALEVPLRGFLGQAAFSSELPEGFLRLEGRPPSLEIEVGRAPLTFDQNSPKTGVLAVEKAVVPVFPASPFIGAAVFETLAFDRSAMPAAMAHEERRPVKCTPNSPADPQLVALDPSPFGYLPSG